MWGKWKSVKSAQRYYEQARSTKDIHESRLSMKDLQKDQENAPNTSSPNNPPNTLSTNPPNTSSTNPPNNPSIDNDKSAKSATNIHSPGNRKFQFTGDGYLSKPEHPCFCAKGTTSHTAGSVVHIDYTTQLFDNGNGTTGCYDPTSGQSKFTAPIAGYYFFHATVMFDSNFTDFGYIFLDFKIDGSAQGRERMMPGRPYGGSFASLENSAIFYLAKDQYVQVYITQSGGTMASVRNDYRFFEGHFIG